MIIQDFKNTHIESATLVKVGTVAHLDPFLVRPSKFRRYLIVISHVIVAAVIFLTSWLLLQLPLVSLSINLVVGILVLINFYFSIKAYDQLIGIEFDGRWHIHKSGEKLDFDRIGHALVWSWLVILYFKNDRLLSPNNSVVIFSDSLPLPQYKALRRWLLTYMTTKNNG